MLCVWITIIIIFVIFIFYYWYVSVMPCQDYKERREDFLLVLFWRPDYEYHCQNWIVVVSWNKSTVENHLQSGCIVLFVCVMIVCMYFWWSFGALCSLSYCVIVQAVTRSRRYLAMHKQSLCVLDVPQYSVSQQVARHVLQKVSLSTLATDTGLAQLLSLITCVHW